MNFISPPSATSRVSPRPDDDLDGLLHAFYRAEMPSPWPELKQPGAAALPPTRLAFWRPVKRSHLALAASVALLVGGSLLFRDKAPPYSTKPPTETNDISGKTKEHLIDPEKVSYKESILVTPDGAVLNLEVDENRY